MSAIVFLDTETTGLSTTDHVWEFAAVRREEDGHETRWHTYLDHDIDLAAKLPESFHLDYLQRYDGLKSLTPADFRTWTAPLFEGRPHIVGAVPDFDTTRLQQILGTHRVDDPWHYHLIDAETLAVGYLRGKLASDGPDWGYMHATSVADLVHTLPWESNNLSLMVGVNPNEFDRHTAMGDVLWAMAIYDAVMGLE